MSLRTWTTATASALVLLSSLPAIAQDDSGDWGPRWGMGRMMMGGGPMGFGPDAMLDRIDGRIAFLKTELKITEAQTPAWDGFADAIRTTSESHNAMMRAMMERYRDRDAFDTPLPERLELHQSHLETRLEQAKVVRAATESLYMVLDDEQKAAADDIVLPAMGMGMGRGMGMGMRRGWRHGPGMMYQ